MKVVARYRPALEAQKLITAIVPYFDRIRVWLDTDLSDPAYAKLRRLCKVERYDRPMPFRRHWCIRLDIFQPTLEALQFHEEAMKGDYLINYVEVTLDYITASPRDAQAIRSFLDQHAIHVTNGQYHYFAHPNNNTRYRGYRGNDRRLVLYTRPRSKSKSARKGPCAHLEMRLQGSEMINKLGIYTLQDLIYFDHRGFWTDHLRLRKIPSQAELGRIYAEQVLGNTTKYSRRYYEKLFLKMMGMPARSPSPIPVQQVLSQLKALEPHLLLIPAASFLPRPARKRPTKFSI